MTILAAVAFAATLSPAWMPTFDGAIYASVSRALARGDGFTYQGYDQVKYPPGFPLLLLPPVLMADGDPLVLRGWMILWAALSVGATSALAYSMVGRGGAILAAALTVGTTMIWALVPYVLSDFPFVTLSTFALALWHRGWTRRRRGTLLVATALAASSALVRTVGLLLGPAMALHVLLARGPVEHRRSLAAAVLVLVVLPSALVAVAGARAPDPVPSFLSEGVSYLSLINNQDWRSAETDTVTWSNVLDRIWHNGGNVAHLGATWFGTPTSVGHAVGLGLLFAAVVGLLMRGRRPDATSLFAVFYAAVLFTLPSHDPRYFLPLFPVLVGSLAWLVHRCPRPWAIAVILVALACGLHARGVVRVIRDQHRSPFYRGAAGTDMTAMAWARTHLSDHATIVVDRGPWWHHILGRRAFSIPRYEDPRRMEEALRSLGATHVVVDGRNYATRFLRPYVAAHPERFLELHRDGPCVIYAVR